MDTVFWDDDFVVCPQSAVLDVLTFVVLELPGCWVEEVGENLGVLTVVLHPVVENGVGWAMKHPMMLGIGRMGPKSSSDFRSSCILLKMSATMFVFPGIW